MKSQWIRYAIIAVFACALGALAHASISGAMQSRNSSQRQTTPETEPGFDQQFRGLETRPASQNRRNQSSENEELQNALLQKLWDVLDAADDLSSEEKSEAREILEEADPVLARIKKENERAIEILRNPPRRVPPKRPAPTTDAEETQASSPDKPETD